MTANPFPSGTISFNDLRTGFAISGQLALGDLNGNTIYDSTSAPISVIVAPGYPFSMSQFQSKYVTCFGSRSYTVSGITDGTAFTDNSTITRIEYAQSVAWYVLTQLNATMTFLTAFPSGTRTLTLSVNYQINNAVTTYVVRKNGNTIDSFVITSNGTNTIIKTYSCSPRDVFYIDTTMRIAFGGSSSSDLCNVTIVCTFA